MGSPRSIRPHATVERDIAERIAAAKLRPRFDKVALRLVGGLRAALSEAIPEGQVVIFTITAPIRLPAKTKAALESLIRGGVAVDEVHATINGNLVRLRRLTGAAAEMPRVLGFAHHPAADAGLILALAEARLDAAGNSAAPP